MVEQVPIENGISWLIGLAEMYVVATLVLSINWSVTQHFNAFQKVHQISVPDLETTEAPWQ